MLDTDDSKSNSPCDGEYCIGMSRKRGNGMVQARHLPVRSFVFLLIYQMFTTVNKQHTENSFSKKYLVYKVYYQ
jgi:hypothetical protein